MRGLGGADELRPLPANELAAAVVDDLGLAGATPLRRQDGEGGLHGPVDVLGAGGEQELAVDQVAAVAVQSRLVKEGNSLCSQSAMIIPLAGLLRWSLMP